MECMYTLTARSGFEVTVKACTAVQLEDALHAHGFAMASLAAAQRARYLPVGDTLKTFGVTIRRVS